MPTWPSNFCPLINSLEESPPENTIRSQMDKGPDIVRRRTTANIRPISFKLYLSKADVAVMDNFFSTECYSGAEAFDFTHPRTGVACKARFTGVPKYANRSYGYEVSVGLEILP